MIRELRVSVQNEKTHVAKEPVILCGEVSSNLGHDVAVGIRGDAGDVDEARRVLDHEQHVVGGKPARGPDSVVKKSAAAITFAWALRNVRQDVGRWGAGSIPWSFERLGDAVAADAPALVSPLGCDQAPVRMMVSGVAIVAT